MSHFLSNRNKHISPTSLSVEISQSSSTRLLNPTSLLSFSSYPLEVSNTNPIIYKSPCDASDSHYLPRSSMFLTETDCFKPPKSNIPTYLDPNQNLSNLILSCSTVQTSLVDTWTQAKRSLNERQSNAADLYKNLKSNPKQWIQESDYLEGKAKLGQRVRAERADCMDNKIRLVDDLLSPKNSSSIGRVKVNNATDPKAHIFISGKDLSNFETAKLISMNRRQFSKKFDEVVPGKDEGFKLKSTRSQCDLYQKKYEPRANIAYPFRVADSKYEESLNKEQNQSGNLNQFIITKCKTDPRMPDSKLLKIRSERFYIPEPETTNLQTRVSPIHIPRFKKFTAKTVSMLKSPPKKQVIEENQEIYEEIMSLFFDMKYGTKLSS